MKIKFNDVTYTYQQGTPYEYKALDHINLTIEQVNTMQLLDKLEVENQL